jgi:hypothetical protein
MGPSGAVPTSGTISLDKFYGLSGSLLGGASWVASPTTTFSVSTDMVHTGGNTLVSVFNNYMSVSSDSGLTWVKKNIVSITGLYYGSNPVPVGTAVGVSSLLWFNNTLWAIGHAILYGGDEYFLLSSTDQGLNWTAAQPTSFVRDNSTPSRLIGATLGYSPLVVAPYFHTGSGTAYNAFWAIVMDIVAGTATIGVRGGSAWAINTVFVPGLQAGIDVGGDGLFIEARNLSQIYTSAEGISWTQIYVYDTNGNVQTATTAVSTKAVVHNSKYFICATDGSIIVSTDGVNFTLHTNVFPGINTTYPLVESNGTYAVAIWKTAAGANMVSTSTDMVSWTHKVTSSLTSAHLNFIHTDSYWVIQDGLTAFKRVPI